jgi:hypothetical protein
LCTAFIQPNLFRKKGTAETVLRRQKEDKITLPF